MSDYDKRIIKNFFKIFGIISLIVIVGITIFSAIVALFGENVAFGVLIAVVMISFLSIMIAISIS